MLSILRRVYELAVLSLIVLSSHEALRRLELALINNLRRLLMRKGRVVQDHQEGDWCKSKNILDNVNPDPCRRVIHQI